MDYEVNEDGVFYDEEDYDEGDGEESDPLAISSDNASDREAREEVFGASIDDIIAETQNKRRKQKKRRLAGRTGAAVPKRLRPSEVPPHLSSVMGAATMFYMNRQFDEAEAALSRIIEEAPKASGPYRTIGLIHEERGDRRKALDAFMTAAELDRQDLDLWKRNAMLWEEEGDLEKAIYCLTRALRASRGSDAEALLARAEFRMLQGDVKKAAENYRKLAKLKPHDVTVVKKIVQICKDTGDPGKAVPALQAAIEHFQQPASRREASMGVNRNEIIFDLIQLLVEIWFGQKKYAESAALLSRMNARFSSAGCPLTFVQRLLVAICQYRMGSETLASPTFIEFMSSSSTMARHSVLLWEVAEAYRVSGDYSKAMKAYSLLAGHIAYKDHIQLLLHRAQCSKELGNELACKQFLQRILQLKPLHVEASIRLAKFYPQVQTERKTIQARRRRERRQANVSLAKASEIADLERQLQPLPPDAPAEARDSTWGSLGYDYLSMEDIDPVAAGAATRDAILVPVSMANVQEAVRIIADGQTAFRRGELLLFFSLVGPPLESALNLKTKMHVVDDDGSGEDDGESDDESESDFFHAVGVQKDPPAKPTVEADAAAKVPDVPLAAGTVADVPGVIVLTERNLNAVGVAMLRESSDQVFAELLESIFEALYRLGRVEHIEQIMSSLFSLAAVRISPESPFKLRIQVLLVVSLFATGRFYDGYDKLRSMLMEAPADQRICTLFALAEEHVSMLDNNERFKTFRSLNRLLKKHPEPFLEYVTALCSARGVTNSHNYTLGKLLRVYSSIPESPLLCLCIVVQLLYVGQNRRVSNRNQVVLYAMAFLDEYRRKRAKTASKNCGLVIELEMKYNAARALHQLGITHIAEELYKSVLSCSDQNIDRLPPWADLRRDAAHNLALIYKQSGSPDLARSLLRTYLVY